jgi:hypothetical protein
VELTPTCGSDDVGKFIIRGRYTARAGECHWTKTYAGAHDVFYRGFREGKGIWGTWELGPAETGGFRIWPLGQSGGDQDSESNVETKPVEDADIVTAPVKLR